MAHLVQPVNVLRGAEYIVSNNVATEYLWRAWHDTRHV
jgi:hypothetical protein